MLALAPVLTGFLYGLRHATDADHVAAVSAIVARERTVRGAALVGAAWGMGHTLTLLLLGGAIVLFGLRVPDRVLLALELGVGLMLLVLGGWNLRPRAHRPAGDHAGPSIDLAGSSGGPSSRVRRALRPLLVGSMHGLAGSAAAVLLVVVTARGTSWGLVCLLLFGVGTMLGMTALTTALALPLGRALRRSPSAASWVRVASGAVSIAIGLLVVAQVSLQGGLFPR
jgi:high-affinity nickel-transport protein